MIPGYFVAPDAYDVPTVWRENGDLPQAVVNRLDFRDDPAVWDALTRLVTSDPCPPLPFTGKACASTEPRPHHCYGTTAYVPDAHDKSEAIQ